jgi:NitT/TauT family transport system permease protein
MSQAVQHSSGSYLLRSSGVLIFLALWEIVPRLELIDPYFVPPLSVVVAVIGKLISTGDLPIHLLVSSWRAVTGLCMALVIALPLGIILGRCLPELAEAGDPLLRVLSQVNPFTLLPVFLLFFGIGETAKVAVVTWVTLWPVLFYTITATRSVDPVQIKSAAAMGVSRPEMLFKVILPASVPTIFVGIRIGASLTFFILIAAEMLGASSGLGWMVHNSAMNYLIPRIYASAFFIVVLGFLFNRFLLFIENSLFDRQESPSFSRDAGQAHVFVWRPGRSTLVVATSILLLVLVLGAFEVRKLNQAAADGNPGGKGHAMHFGTPIDSSPGGL